MLDTARMGRLSGTRSNSAAATQEARRLLELLTALGRYGTLRDPIAAAVEAMGFTHAQVHALLWLGNETRLTMGDLAQRIGVTEKSVTGVVDRLEREQYACRVRKEGDRRVVQVELTEKGARTYRELNEEILQKTSAFLRVLDREDRDALFRIMERLAEKFAPAGVPATPAKPSRTS